MANFKYYVVWNGRKPGIFDNWRDCQKQIYNFPYPIYKGYQTLKEAEMAYFGKTENRFHKKEQNVGSPIMDSISVDCACKTSTWEIQYRAIYTNTKEVFFKVGPLQDGTNNIAEFLAIVETLMYCKKNSISLPIYSDSMIAIRWVKNKMACSNKKRNINNIDVFKHYDDAIEWLKNNRYENKILKWHTKSWGENPADFGRK